MSGKTGNGSNAGAATGEVSAGQKTDNYEEMVYRIKSSIDNIGRYKWPLHDLATGLSAGTGMSKPEAKKAIEDNFAAKVGSSPFDYLQSCYDYKQQQDQARGTGRGRGR